MTATFTVHGQTYHWGYVIIDTGGVYVQLPAPESRWGFVLADDDQTWDGGFGLAAEWEAVPDDDPRVTDEDRERLSWLLDERDEAVQS
jgi:hypothetical protein